MKTPSLDACIDRCKPHREQPTATVSRANNGPVLWWGFVNGRWKVAVTKNWSVARDLIGGLPLRANAYHQYLESLNSKSAKPLKK